MESVCSGFMFRTRSWRAAKDGGYEAGLKSNVIAVRPVPACRSMPSRRPRDTPIWKFEAALKCRSFGTRRYKPPVHMVKLTQEREIRPYPWVHPDDDDRRQ
jgi:hypothetical protein